MSRIREPKADEAIRIAADRDSANQVVVVRGGKNCYLWVVVDGRVATYSGPATLRKFAQAILAEVGES